MSARGRVPKVCFAASSGGHLEQLMALKSLMERYDSFILTEKTEYAIELSVRTLYVGQVNRHDALFAVRMMANFAFSLWTWIKERPDVIVCTGVLATIPFCLVGKMLGSNLVYIESFAKTDSATQTGRLLYRFADRFYVQWKSMLKVYPKAIYIGGIY